MQRYKVLVVGHIWWPNGFHGGKYQFDAENDEEAEDWGRINKVAGDFSIVTDFELYREENCPMCGQVIWECIREFSEEEAALIFAACMA